MNKRPLWGSVQMALSGGFWVILAAAAAPYAPTKLIQYRLRP